MGRQTERSDRTGTKDSQQAVEHSSAETASTAAPDRPGAGLLAMQRGHGNQHVQQLLATARTGHPGDRWEREADQMARVAASAPGPVDSTLGSMLGADLSDVRIHTGADAAQATSALDAHAFTRGRDVYFGDGEYEPGSRGGRELIAHELVHVAQQSSDGAAAPVQLKKKKPKATGAVLASIQRLQTSIGGTSAAAVRHELKERLEDGPPLSRAQLDEIDALALTRDPAAVTWLKDVGLDPLRVATYLDVSNYRKWVLQDAVMKVHAASIAWHRNIGRGETNPNPAYTLGRHMAIKGGALAGVGLQTAEAERDDTIRTAFLNTLTPDAARRPANAPAGEGDRVDEAAMILRRILLLLHAGTQVYDQGQQSHVDYTGDVARLLAHGGRVTIRIPALLSKKQNAFELTDWLGITDNGHKVDAVYNRSFGTHSVGIDKNTTRKDGTKKLGGFREGAGAIKANTTNTLDGDVGVWGMDMAAGGYGRRDFNGDVIRPNGGHGHMFIGFTKPQKGKDGALQIGLETTAPGKDEFSTVGKDHGITSNEANANPESSFYGHKTDKVGNGPLEKVGRLLDLNRLEATGSRWQDKLDDLETAWIVTGGLDARLVGPQGTF